MTDIKASPPVFARVEGQNADVVPGSPLGLLACYAELVRQRFRGTDLPWVYAENATNDPAENVTPGHPRKIMVEPAYGENSGQNNYRPSITVNHGAMRATKIAIGNTAGVYLPTDLTGYISHQSVLMDMEVISTVKGECMVLGDTVYGYLMCNWQPIRELFGFRDLSLPAMSEVVPNPRDRNEWVCHVTQEVETTFRWISKPIAPILRETVLRLNNMADEELIKLYSNAK